MLVLAVTNAEKLRQISGKELAYLGLGILVLILAVLLLQRAAKLNGLVFFMVAAVAVFVVGVTWVYQRNEPKFMTPFIDKVSQFFPSAPTPYSQRQVGVPGAPNSPQKPGAPPAQQKPGTQPADQKPAPPPPSKVY